MSDEELARLVSLGCHDLRTPLATVTAAAKLLLRQGGLTGREAQLADLIDGAAGELALLIDQLSLAARVAGGRYEPALRDADTLELASGTAQVAASGVGAVVHTDAEGVTAALAALAAAAARHGRGEGLRWGVEGRRLRLEPLGAEAELLLERAEPRDLRARVATLLLESLGARLSLEPGALLVELA